MQIPSTFFSTNQSEHSKLQINSKNNDKIINSNLKITQKPTRKKSYAIQQIKSK
jgi:hypothetical protein